MPGNQHPRPNGGQPQRRRPQQGPQRPPGPKRYERPVVWRDPDIRDSPPMSVGLVAGIGVILLIVLAAIIFNVKGGGTSDKSQSEATKAPNVAVGEVKPCAIVTETGPRPRIFLNTDERVKACTETKRYTKTELVKKFGKDGEKEYGCLELLWTGESQWSAWAKNPTSGAYGISQIHPKIHGYPVKEGDGKGQVDWGLDYIYKRYKTPCNAWAFWQCKSSCRRYPPDGEINKLGRDPDDPQTNWY